MARPETVARSAPWAVALLVVLLGWRLAGHTWTLLDPPAVRPAAGTLAPAANHAPPPTAGRQAPPPLLARQLFGNPETAPAPQPIAEPTQETPLNLRLAGVFFGESGAPALALIAEGQGEERPYPIGATLPGNARLEEIRSNQVVLARAGRLETLSLPKSGGSAGGVAAAPLPTAAPEAPAGITIDAGAVMPQLREALSGDPEALQNLAALDPYMQDGQFVGFRIRPGRDRRLLAQLGLRSGDILVEVNGTRLQDPAQGLGLLQEVMQANQVAVQVLRNGTEVPLFFDLTPR